MKWKYRRAKSYCWCDMVMLATWKKCPVCWRREIKKLIKKEHFDYIKELSL